MKKKPSQELVSAMNNSKDFVRRLKSPQNKRAPVKKQQQIPSVILPRHKPIKSKQEQKADSNNTTSSNRPKNPKLSKKIKYKQKGQLKEKKIMNIIISFATKIQRQWRVFAFRKRVKQFMSKIKIQEQQQEQIDLKPKSQFLQLKFDNKKIRRLVQFQEEQISSGTTLYDRSKYQNALTIKEFKSKGDISIKSKSKKASVYSKSSTSTPRNRVERINKSSKTPKEMNMISEQLSRSLERPLSCRSKQAEIDSQQRRSSFNTFEQIKLTQNRRHSTGQLQPPLRSISGKTLQVSKAYDLRIGQSEKTIRRQKEQNTRILREPQTEANIAFRKGTSIEKMMHKCKKQLQMKKLKQLLSVENRYTKNEVTYRSYLEIIGKINEDHTTKLEQIKVKEGQLKSTLGQLLQLYRSNPQEVRFAEDEHQGSTSNLDVSLSFDRWDFNSSAKKSIDHLDMPEGNSSKVLSIESVLRELDEQDSCLSDQKRFKKNKNLQRIDRIEAIAERSKQISEKDVASFQNAPNTSVQHIAIEQVKTEEYPYCMTEEAEDVEEKNNSTIKVEQIKYQSPEKEKIQSKESIKASESQSQSFQITPAGPPHLNSSSQIVSNPSDKLLNELIFKEIKTDPQIVVEDPLIIKLKEMILQKTIMNNIKVISSLKFAFARASSQKSKNKITKQKVPSIRANINTINGWLLQVSHFMLDNYEKVISQNIIKVKQPPVSEVFMMARKQISLIPLYETIPEYVFKDFEFGYIRALARKYQVKDIHYEQFSGFVYTFHRALIDSLNTALMDELVTGKQWIQTPWKAPQKFKAPIIHAEHTKLCLERVINMVSNWAEYSLGRLEYEQDFQQAEYRQFEEQKIFLVCRQQVQETRLSYSFSMGHILLLLSDWVYESELEMLVQQMQEFS